jgi:hypothetical protein
VGHDTRDSTCQPPSRARGYTAVGAEMVVKRSASGTGQGRRRASLRGRLGLNEVLAAFGSGAGFRRGRALATVRSSMRGGDSRHGGTAPVATEKGRSDLDDIAIVLIYELLDAHRDTEDMARDLARRNIRWRAHIEYLRALQRQGREIVAQEASDGRTWP